MIVKTTFLLVSFFVLSFVSFAQNSCPSIDKRNNGNGQWSSAPGDFRPSYTQNNPVPTNINGTKYQKLTVNPSSKAGELVLNWANLDVNNLPVITKAWYTNTSNSTSALSTVFGPPSVAIPGETKATYCYYGANLPTTGTLTLEYSDPQTQLPIYICAFNLANNQSVATPNITAAYPKITTHPASIAVLANGAVTFSVVATSAVSYKWQFSSNGTTWSDVDGADFSASANQLTVLNRANYNNYFFRAIVTNLYGSVTSNAAKLTIEQLPTAVFTSAVNCDNVNLKTVSIKLTGKTPFKLTYNINNGANVVVNNITSTSYSLPVSNLGVKTTINLVEVSDAKYTNTQLSGQTTFSAYKKDGLVANTVTLTDEDKNVVFNLSGSTYKTVNIQSGTRVFPNFAPLSNQSVTNNQVSFALNNDGTTPGTYDFILTLANDNGTCINKLSSYVVTKQNKLQITKQPVSQTYLENGTATFTVSSVYATSFLWQYSFNDGLTWNDIKKGGNFTKVTKDTLEIANRLYYKKNRFRVVFYGKYENVTSASVLLTVDRKPLAFFEGTKKCVTPKTKNAIVYMKGIAPFKITYTVNNGAPITITNITKEVYTITVDSTITTMKLINVSDARFANVPLDSSNTIAFYNKPSYTTSLKAACLNDTSAELTLTGKTPAKFFNLTTGDNPILGFATIQNKVYSSIGKFTLPRNVAIGSYGFIVSGNDGNCSSDDVKVNLTIKELPIVVASASKYTINQGETISLTGSGGDSYIWTPKYTLSDSVGATVNATPSKTTTYTMSGFKNGCYGKDTVKINVNTLPSSSLCSPITVTVLPEDIRKATCTSTADGQITFTIANGSSNNKYRLRKKNEDGTFTVLTTPAFAPLNNTEGEAKTITVSNLTKGNYDLFAFCGQDAKVTKVYNFSISSLCDTTTNNGGGNSSNQNYTCKDMSLTIENTDINPITCDNVYGSVTFTVSGGAPNFTYRLRKHNPDNTFTIVSNPVFVSIGNLALETKRVTIDELPEGEYELYVYCSQDVTYFKSLSFSIYKENCKSVLKDVISYYSFDKNNSDSLKRALAPEVVGAVKTNDNYGNLTGAYRIYNATDKLTFTNFVDIDTLTNYTVSFWYKLLELPRYNNSTLISIPNGSSSKRFEVLADKNGNLKVQFGAADNSILNNTSFKVEPGTWNQMVLTHAQDSDRVYINDELIATYASNILSNNGSDLIVGFDGRNKTLRFLFDELKLSAKTISYQDVKDNFYADVRENCTGIRLNIEVLGSTIKFVVSNGSTNNKYRIRKKDSKGNFVTISKQAFISLYNKLGESKSISLTSLSPGIYDIYAYCGSDSKKYQGYEFIVDNNGNASIYRKITPTETIDISTENAQEVKEEIYLNVYPNPVDNIINIDIIGANPTVQKDIKLISSNGVLVHSESFTGSENSSTINVENLRAGVYILEVHLEDNRVERKQIVIN
jgi:hypothetical protein